MKKQEHITAFYVETLLLILVFIAIILVLTHVFGLGKVQSSRAKLLTNAVCLAENAAEAVAASDSPAAVVRLLDEGGNVRVLDSGLVEADYNSRMEPELTRDPGLRVLISWEPTAEDPRLVNSTISVYGGGKTDAVYELRTAVLLQEVGS